MLVPKTRRQKLPLETRGRNGASGTDSATQRVGQAVRTPRYRGHFEYSSANGKRDRTGWLGREDSNLRMAESKSAGRFLLLRTIHALSESDGLLPYECSAKRTESATRWRARDSNS